jgi:hypothetical protein
MKTERVEVEGSTVTIRADSEATAREIAAAADRDRIKREGGVSERIDQKFDSIGDVVDGLFGRPAMGILGWVLATVASVMAFLSFERLAPSVAMQVLFGIVGVVFVAAQKVGAARWAKADNMKADSLANFYRWMTFGAMAIVFAVSVAYQSAVSADVDSGATGIDTKIETLERAIREAEYDAGEMVRPQDPQETLRRDLDRRLARPAKNRDGAPAGFTVGEAVGAGERGEDGLMPATFCMPNTGRQTYIDRECPDLIDMEKGLQRRIAYDQAIAAIDKKKLEVETLAKTKPKKSSALELGETFGKDGKLAGFILSAAWLAFIEAFMVFFVYVSKRHPKGVTEALARMSAPAEPQPGRV